MSELSKILNKMNQSIAGIIKNGGDLVTASERNELQKLSKLTNQKVEK